MVLELARWTGDWGGAVGYAIDVCVSDVDMVCLGSAWFCWGPPLGVIAWPHLGDCWMHQVIGSS